MHQEEKREHKALTSLSMDCSVEEEQQPHRLGGTVVKRKRTERRHHHTPAATSSTSSSESTTTEEDDMAHCLILLAQGGAGAHATVDHSSPPLPQPQVLPATALPVRSERYTSRKYTESAVTADGSKVGSYVYECKTCSKCFPTFQALGGHRASHKRPCLAAASEENTNTGTNPIAIKPSLSPPTPSPAEAVLPDTTATALTLNAGGSSNKLRVHECSICGAEFASGQALGGHMRRHRPLNAPDQGAVTAVTAQVKNERSLNLELDLNLPAPSEEETTSPLQVPEAGLGFVQFDNGKKGLMLTASALVDCHY